MNIYRVANRADFAKKAHFEEPLKSCTVASIRLTLFQR